MDKWKSRSSNYVVVGARIRNEYENRIDIASVCLNVSLLNVSNRRSKKGNSAGKRSKT